jgi:long-chain acyl-CoA synthetase
LATLRSAKHRRKSACGTEFRIDATSVTLINTLVFTNATWMMLLPTVGASGMTVLLPTFTPERIFRAVQAEKVTHPFLVPTQFQTIVEHPDFDEYDLSSLRIMVSMGSAMPLSLKKRVLDRMGKGLMELYGITEGIGTTLKPEEIVTKTGSVGRPISGTDIRVIDNEGNEVPAGESGEIVGFGAGMMTGYHNRPEATEEALWPDEKGRTFLRTGDRSGVQRRTIPEKRPGQAPEAKAQRALLASRRRRTAGKGVRPETKRSIVGDAFLATARPSVSAFLLRPA